MFTKNETVIADDAKVKGGMFVIVDNIIRTVPITMDGKSAKEIKAHFKAKELRLCDDSFRFNEKQNYKLNQKVEKREDEVKKEDENGF